MSPGRWWVLLWLLVAWGVAWGAAAGPLVLGPDTRHESLAGRLAHFADAGGQMDLDQARRQRFVPLPEPRSLGYDGAAHWFRFSLRPAAGAPRQWLLALGSPELEEVDVWVGQPDGSFQAHALGYHRPYAERPLQTRLFTVPLEVVADTEVYLRVQTANAIIVDATVWQPAAFIAEQTRGDFGRGLYFGALVIAVLLYALLGLWLRDGVMGAYAGYIASMAIMNLGTAGYLPVLIGGDGGWFSDALPRLGWLGGAVSIVLMWDRLLVLQTRHRPIHRLFQFTLLLNLVLLPFALMPFLVTAPLLWVVKFANYLNSANFFISLTLVFVLWWRERRPESGLYFLAFVIPALATLVNTATNQGLLPQNVVTSNLYQLAPLVHLGVMSLGLALRLRALQVAKGAAEQEADLARQRADEQRRFVAMLSHEFRNPLAAIDRATQMIQFKLPGVAPSEAQRLGHIRTNVATLSRLVDNFLMTEALDHGGLGLARESCALAALIQGVLPSLGEAAHERIQVEVQPEGACYDLDPTLMAIALGNLLGNALRYSPPASPVQVRVRCPGTGLLISVSDQGPGLDAAELARLGTPYFRAASSLGQKGSGLGFHFSRRIVEAHGGRLGAYTNGPPGTGLTVEMAFGQGD